MTRRVHLSARPVTALIALLAVVASTFAVAASPAAAGPDNRPKVLLLPYDEDEYIPDVQTKLQNSGLFSVVDRAPGVPCTPNLPTLDALLEYDSVLFWSDCAVPQADALGDVLADYVDAGGHLVMAVFATAGHQTAAGRLVNDGYVPVRTGGYTSRTRLTLVADLPGHPLLEGVTSLDGGSGSWHGTGLSVTPGSTLVAHWSNGEPLVVTRDRVTVLNFFPPSSDIRSDFWEASTDGLRLMTNALGGKMDLSPKFTSAATATFSAGAASSFTITAAGAPKPTITTASTLPSGVTLTDNGDGTATLAGTPAAGTGGTYSVELTAANGIGDDATQTLAVTVNEAPIVSSLDQASYQVGVAGSFTVTTTAGFPAATTLTATGDLPAGVTFTDNGDGTATVAGTPADDTAGSYPVMVTADNGVLSTTQTLNLSVARQGQTVEFTSTAPSSAVVGQTYEVSATGGDSGNPVVLSVHEDSAAVCSIDGTTVTFDHVGSCALEATQAGNGRYLAASASQAVAVSAASTTTDLEITAGALTAKVAPVAPGAGTPAGTVTFSVDGDEVGSAPLVDGVATLAHRVESGKRRAVAAVYAGNDDYTGSSASTARQDPIVKARVSSAKAKSAAGWYRTSVKVTFTCTPQGAQLTAPCPKPVTLAANRAGQSVTRTILAADGGAATVTVSGINIDRVAPTVAVKGVRKGATYPGQAPKARCASSDSLSGIARCKVTKRVSGESVTVTATATDRAGNSRSASVRHRVAKFYVAGATFRKGAFQVREGKTYVVVALASGTARPQYMNASLRGGKPTASGSYLTRSGSQAGKKRYTIAVRMDRGMSRRGAWDLGVKTGKTLHRIPVDVRR